MKNIKKYFFNIDIIIYFCIIILSLISIIFIFSASNKNIYITLKRIIQIIIGNITMIFMSKINISFIKKNIFFLYIINNIFLIMVFFNKNINRGSKRWLNIGIINFQPSEIMKIILPIVLSQKIKKKLNYIFIILLPTLLTMLQPDLGTSILIFISGFNILYLKGINKNKIIKYLITLILSIPIIWKYYLHDYQKKRIFTLINSYKDPLRSGYHINKSKIAIGSGGILGKGLFKGSNIIPEIITDFIFSIISEELGFLGIIFIFLIYIILIIRCFYISITEKNYFNKLLKSGLTINFTLYIITNICMTSGLIPVVGIPLPLISYGGSSMISIMSILGIIMNLNNKKFLFINK